MNIAVSSEFINLECKTKSQRLYCKEQLEKCDQFNIATGYISSDSIIELNKIVEENKTPNVKLFIGMHFFDLFTEVQYDAVKKLSTTLSKLNRGKIYISKKLKYHGKMYSFIRNNTCFSASIGSSNFDSFLCGSKNTCEIDSFHEGAEAEIINQKIESIINDLGEPFDSVTIDRYKPEIPLIDNHYGVNKLPDGTFKAYSKNLTGNQFYIPLKTEQKSNLNVFFGKGRENPRGFVIPRPWYEVELIVPQEIRKNPNYPSQKKFNVITKEDYSFFCETNGDNAKNFRSSDDLSILGKYIKGKMENTGALKIGEPVNEKVLEVFKYNSILLRQTKESPNTWLLSFENI
ncbi:MAG: NgoFVII family restriction endonuclease [Opitutales bacterium]|nr:NgoFVII family restriction endonuclease [Opitutales bacterium]